MAVIINKKTIQNYMTKNRIREREMVVSISANDNSYLHI